MFHDDDALINLEKVIKFFDGPTAREMNCFGFLGENSRPHRWGKYNVTEVQWESGAFRFISGHLRSKSRRASTMLDVIGSHKRLFQVIIFLNFVPVHVMACPVNLLRRFLKLPNKLRPMDFDLKMFYFWELFEKKQKWKFLISKRFVTLNLIGRNLIGQERHLVCTRLKLKK